MHDAYQRDLRSLLLDRITFVVPPFQRHYVWTADEWNRLWEDLLEVARRDGGARYFLGAIVLQHTHERAGEPKIRDVVDGQQRLTTVQVLLAALRDLAQSNRLVEVADRARELTAHRLHGPEQGLKVVPAIADQDAFRHAMTAGSPGALLSLYPKHAQPPIVQAYRHFSRLLNKLRAQHSDPPAALAGLVDALSDRTYLVVMDLSESDDPQVIYERLNSGGTPLRASELVRNHIFYQCARQGLANNRLYETYWADFDDGYWFDSDGPRTRLDDMLRSYLIMELRRSISYADLFSTFREYVRTRLDDLEAVLERLATYGQVYASLDTGEGLGPFEAAFVERLRVLETTVFTPVLLRLFGGFDRARREPALVALQSYVVRRDICRRSPRSHADQVLPLLQALAGATDPGPVVRGHLAGLTGAAAWPSNQDLIAGALTQEAYSRQLPNRRARTRMVLALAEGQLLNDLTEPLRFDWATLSLEHLLPQGWDPAAWPIAETDPARIAEERAARTRLVHTLGNLTMIPRKLNEKVANGPWEEKVAELHTYSALRLNHHLPDRFAGAEAIRRRGTHLAGLIAAALPPPPAAPAWVPAPAPEAADEPESNLDDGADDGPDDGPDDGLDEGPDELEPLVPPAPQRRSIGLKIRHVLGAADGGPLTYREIADATAVAFPDDPVNAQTVRNLLSRWAVSGVQRTTKDGRVAGVVKPRRSP